MNVRALMLGAMVPLAAIGGVIAMACGGDDDGGELSLEEYFAELEALDTEFEQRTDALDAQLNQGMESVDPEDLDAVVEVFSGFLDDAVETVADFVDGLDGLNPPPEVETEHEAAVDAGRTVVEEFERLTDDVADFDSVADFIAMEEEPGFTDASDDFDQACFDLQDIADENDIDIELNCGE